MANNLARYNPSIVATQESGSKAHATQFNKALGKAMGGTWDDVLYGDGWDISQTVTSRTDLYKDVKRGYIRVTPAGPGTSHNIWTYKILEDKKTTRRFVVVSFHLEHRAGLEFDKAREKQCLSGIPQIEKIADGLPVIFTGDANSGLDNAYDGPGKAFTKHGYADTENVAAKTVAAAHDSYNGLVVDAKKKKNNRQIDRVFVKTSQITVRRRIIAALTKNGKYETPFGSDHWPVVVDLTIK